MYNMSEKTTQNMSMVSNRISVDLEEQNVKEYNDMTISILELLSKAQTIDDSNNIEYYDPIEDFKWYTSGNVDTSSFKGKYVAIWKKQIVGSGDTAMEVERLAKAYCGSTCKPAIIYIPEDETSIL